MSIVGIYIFIMIIKNKKAQAISFLRYNSSFLIMRYVNVNIIC